MVVNGLFDKGLALFYECKSGACWWGTQTGFRLALTKLREALSLANRRCRGIDPGKHGAIPFLPAGERPTGECRHRCTRRIECSTIDRRVDRAVYIARHRRYLQPVSAELCRRIDGAQTAHRCIPASAIAGAELLRRAPHG